jgi:two-component system, LytTR family, sensor kinase
VFLALPALIVGLNRLSVGDRENDRAPHEALLPSRLIPGTAMEKYKAARRRGIVVALGWAGATIFLSTLMVASMVASGQVAFAFTLYLNGVLCGLWTLSLPLLARCVQRFPFRHGDMLRHGAALLLIIAALANLVWIAWAAIIYWTWFPFRVWNITFISALTSERGMWQMRANLLVGIVLVMALQVMRVRQDFQAEQMRGAELERQLAESQLAALRMQIHPHFLFNTLHTIAGLIGDQPATARRMVVALGDFLRLTLKDGRTSVRSLAQELEFADLYMGIEKLRLGDRLILDYEIEPAAATAEVPHMLLQPLFENAIRHGAARLTRPCRIAFHAQLENGRLTLSLENDGLVCPAPPDAPSQGVGLTNTMARLSLHYGDDFVFEYTNRPQGGARIDLSLPWRKASRR